MLLHDAVSSVVWLLHIQGSSWIFLPPEHFPATHEFPLFGFTLIVTDHEILVFFSRPVVTCGCVGPIVITVLRDRRRQHGLFLSWAATQPVWFHYWAHS